MNLFIFIAAFLCSCYGSTTSVMVLSVAASRVAKSFGYIQGSSQYLAILDIGEEIYKVHSTMEHETLTLRIWENVLVKMAQAPADWLSDGETEALVSVRSWIGGPDIQSEEGGGICPVDISFGALAGVIRFTNAQVEIDFHLRVARLAGMFRAVSLSLPDARYLAEQVLGVKPANVFLRSCIWMSMIDSALRWPCVASLTSLCLCDFEDYELRHMNLDAYREWIFTPRFLTFDAAWTQHYAYVAFQGQELRDFEWDRMAINVAGTLSKYHLAESEAVLVSEMKLVYTCLFLRDIVHWAASETNPVPMELSFDSNIYLSARGARIASVVNGYAQTRATPISPGSAINGCVHHETFPLLADGLYSMYPSGIPADLLKQMLDTFTPFAFKYLGGRAMNASKFPMYASLPLSRSLRAFASGERKLRNHFALCAAGVSVYTNTTPPVAYLAQVVAHEDYWERLRALSHGSGVSIDDLLHRLVPVAEHSTDSFSVLKAIANTFQYERKLKYNRVYLLVFFRQFIVEQLVTLPTEKVRLPWFVGVPLSRILTRAAVFLGHSEKSVSALLALCMCYFSYKFFVRSSNMSVVRRNTDIVLKEQLRAWFGVLPESFADFLTRMTPDGNVLLVTIFAANLAMCGSGDSRARVSDAQVVRAQIMDFGVTVAMNGTWQDELNSHDGGTARVLTGHDDVTTDSVPDLRLGAETVTETRLRADRDDWLTIEDCLCANGTAGFDVGAMLSSGTASAANSTDTDDSSPRRHSILRSLRSLLGRPSIDSDVSSGLQPGAVVHRLDRSTDLYGINVADSDDDEESNFIFTTRTQFIGNALLKSDKRKSFIKRAIKPLSRSLRASLNAFLSVKSQDDGDNGPLTPKPIPSLETVATASLVQYSIDRHSLEYRFLDILLPQTRKINRASLSRWATFMNFAPHNILTIIDAIPDNKIGIPRDEAIESIYAAIMSLSTRSIVIAENVSVIS